MDITFANAMLIQHQAGGLICQVGITVKLHTIKGYIQNMYLAEYPERLLLLDGASRADIPTLQHFIEDELNRPFSHLHTVVVTHMHPDHAGAAHQLRALTGCKIISANKDHDWYCGLDGFCMHLADLALARWMANRLGRPRQNLWYPRVLKPDIKLNDGDTIPHFNEWQILETLGHTDRDLSVYHAQQGIVYVADLMVEVKKQLIASFPIFHPNQYRQSLERIFKLNPETLLLAHGKEGLLSEKTYQHLLNTAPIRPITHWRVVKIKVKSLMKSVWQFGVSKGK